MFFYGSSKARTKNNEDRSVWKQSSLMKIL